MSISGLIFGAIVYYVEKYWFLGIFVTMTLESALIPIPSEVVMTFSGYVAWRAGSPLKVLEATVAGVAGNLLGSLLLYYLGAHGGRGLVIRYGKYVLVTREKLERAERWFDRHGDWAVFFGRMLPAVRTVISLPAGVFRMDVKRFVVLTVAGSVPWNLILAYLGYATGPYWSMLEGYFTYLDILGISVLVLMIILWVYGDHVKILTR